MTQSEWLPIIWVLLLPQQYPDSTCLKIQTSENSYRLIRNLLDDFGTLEWRLRVSDLFFGFIHRSIVENQEAYAMAKLQTEVEGTNHFDNSLPLEDGENTNVTAGDKPGNYSRARFQNTHRRQNSNPGNHNEDTTGKVERSTRTVQATKSLTKRSQVPTIEEGPFKHRKNTYCRRLMKQVGMSGLNFQIDHIVHIFGTLEIHSCLQNMVPVLPREFMVHAKIYPPHAGHPG